MQGLGGQTKSIMVFPKWPIYSTSFASYEVSKVLKGWYLYANFFIKTSNLVISSRCYVRKVGLPHVQDDYFFLF